MLDSAMKLRAKKIYLVCFMVIALVCFKVIAIVTEKTSRPIAQ